MRKILSILLILALLFILSSCEKNPEIHNHEYIDEVVAPTCTEKGYTKHTCECGDTYNDSDVDALGHNFCEWVVVKEATEEAAGSKERVCSVCGNKETEEIAKLDHTHKYTDTVVEPTCTEGGYTEHKCECGHSYKDNETQPSHKEQVLEAKEATCTEDGLTEGKKCSVCNEVLVEQEIVEATGHEYGDWVIDLQPTSSTIGIMSKHCKICGARGEVTEIPKLDVDYKRVTFITNTDVKIKDVFVKKGEKVMEPSELLIKEGYIFDGWYYNNEKWSFVGYIVTENMILEARWKPISLTIKWLNNDNNVIKLNESLKLEMVIYPQGISQNFIFETSNSTVATVDNYGNVNALSSGKVVIRAFSKVNTKYYLDIELIIVDSDIESFEIIGSSIMKTNSENNLKVIIEPSSLDTDNIKWSVNDSSMASVSKNGVVRSNSSYGVFVVTAQLECGIYDTFEITVTSTGYPDLNGYTIKIAQSDENSTKINPFLSDYTLNDKKAKMIAWREVETLFNCKIEVVPYPSTAAWGPSRWNYIIDQSVIIGTSEYDFLTVPDSKIPLLADAGALIDLTNFYNIYGNNIMNNLYIESGSYKNKLYSLTDAIPNIYNVMYYNIGLLETLQQYNEELQEPARIFLDGNWTFSKFKDYCQEVQYTMAQAFGVKGTAGDAGQEYFAVSGWDSYWWVGLSSNDGEPLADTITGKINIDTPHKVQAAEVVKNLYTKKLASPFQSFTQNVIQWNEGKALFSTGDLWFVGDDNGWKSDLWGEDTRYGYVPWPRANDVEFDEIQVALGGTETWVMPIGRDYSQYGEECTTENIYWAIAELFRRTDEYYKSSDEYNPVTEQNNLATQYAHSEASKQAFIYMRDLIKSGKGYFDPLVTSDNSVASLYTNSTNRTTIKGAVTQYCATRAVGTWKEAIAALVPVLEESLNNSYIDVNYEIPYYTVNFITGTDVEIEPQVLKRLSIPQKPNITLEKEGYKFLGWGTNEYYVKEDVFEKVLTGDKTLYAVWEKIEYIEDPSNSAEELINSLYYEMKDNGTFDKINYFPFGKTDRLDSEGNITNVMPLPKTIGEATSNLAGYEDIEITWTVNEDGLFDENYKLLKQYLRYHETTLTYAIEYQGNTATLEKVINVGITETKNTIYLGGNWYQQSGKGEVSGDVLCMLSKFDSPRGVLGGAAKTWGYSYSYGQFQGTTWYIDIFELDADGNPTDKFTRYQYFAHAGGFHTLDDMYKIELSNPNDRASAVITLNEELNKYIGTNYGGNWAAIYHNVTDHDIKIPFAPLGANAFLKYEEVKWENHPWMKSGVIARDNAFSIDGWRIGFVVDGNGKVVAGSGADSQFQVSYDADGDGQLTEADYWVTIPAGGYAYTPRTQQNYGDATGIYMRHFCQVGAEIKVSYFDPYFLSPDGTSEGIGSWKHE